MSIRDYLTRNRSAPSSPKVRVSGGKGSDAGEIEERLAVLMEPFMRRGKDKSHTDNDDEVEDFSLN